VYDVVPVRLFRISRAVPKMLGPCRNEFKPQIAIRPARTEAEITAHFFIRKEVFVQEQGIFRGSDEDEFDKQAIPLICRVDGHIAGTVRVYPVSNNTWIGGRLAVLKAFRVFGVGSLLVKAAVKTVKQRGCTKFLAHIQPQNVRFFKKLGWLPTGNTAIISGLMHHEMCANLD